MTIVVPENYHAKSALQKHCISCKTEEEALKEDIRSLRIGILNIMPKAETYEFNLLYPLGRSILQVEPVWLRLKTHKYNSTDDEHLKELYVTFEEAVAEKHLDGLILTGAPVEEIAYEDVYYWDEVNEILDFARKNIASTLGICWGGLAIAKTFGIQKDVQKKKIFGVFETKNLIPHHKITGGLDDVFLCPYSSFSRLPDGPIEKARDEGKLNLLAYSKEAGYMIFESPDHKFIVHLGHPEYPAKRLVEEYERDMEKGREDVELPKNLDIKNPLNRWRGHCLDFFAQWIKHVHETTPH
ncbi:homoserine O-succinyltransferase [Spirochaetota bacterium]